MFAVVKGRKAYSLVKGSDNLLEGENGKELYLRFTRPAATVLTISINAQLCNLTFLNTG